MVDCKAENYKVKEMEDFYLVYDWRYGQKTFLVFVLAVFEVILPDTYSFNVPVAIKIKKTESPVLVEKDLKVTGTSEYEYFLPEKHYKQWRITYNFAFILLIFLALAVTILAGYIFMENRNVITGACFGIMIFITAAVVHKYVRQLKIVKKYPIVSD